MSMIDVFCEGREPYDLVCSGAPRESDRQAGAVHVRTAGEGMC